MTANFGYFSLSPCANFLLGTEIVVGSLSFSALHQLALAGPWIFVFKLLSFIINLLLFHIAHFVAQYLMSSIILSLSLSRAFWPLRKSPALSPLVFFCVNCQQPSLQGQPAILTSSSLSVWWCRYKCRPCSLCHATGRNGFWWLHW